MKAKSSTAKQGAGVISWPEGVAAEIGTSTMTLARGRAAGDAPKLYAISERRLVTTAADLLAWVQSKEVPAGYKCRAPVARRAKSAAGEVTQ